MTMKTISTFTLAAALTAGTFHTFAQQDDPLARLRAQRLLEQQQLSGQPAAAPAPTAAPAPDATTATPAAVAPPPPAVDDTSSMDAPDVTPEPTVDYTAATSPTLSTNGITFNFRNAPLDQVLTYMSDAAGFIIVLNTQVSGNVSVISTHPITKDEAVDLLNSRLNQLGYAAIRDGRTLTIMTKQDAKTGNIPVKVNADPSLIPKNDEIVTQIIPIRFVDAEQLVVDLSPFVSPQAIIIANQAGNSIVITDTQANIRHLAEIIKSIDSSAEMETSIQVFPLKYANPNDVVTMLAGVFPSGTGSNPTSIGGGRGGRGGGGFAALFGGGAGAGAGGGNSSQARVQKAQQVLAVADSRTQSVVVTASKDMMPQIAEMISEVDVDSERDQKVYTYHLDTADPYEAAQVLQSMFGGNTTRNNNSTTADVRTQRAAASSTTTSTSSTGFGTSTSGGSRTSGGLF